MRGGKKRKISMEAGKATVGGGNRCKKKTEAHLIIVVGHLEEGKDIYKSESLGGRKKESRLIGTEAAEVEGRKERNEEGGNR